MQLQRKLKKLKIKNIKIRSIHREIQDLRTGIVKGQSFNGMPKTPSNDNRTEDLNIKITDKIDELYKQIEQEQKEQEDLTQDIE